MQIRVCHSSTSKPSSRSLHSEDQAQNLSHDLQVLQDEALSLSPPTTFPLSFGSSHTGLPAGLRIAEHTSVSGPVPLLLPLPPVHQESERGLAGWFWLQVIQDVKMLARAAVIRRLDWGRKSHF